MKRRRLVWIILLTCVFGLPLALYAGLPFVAGLYLQSYLEQQGFQKVVVQLGYPGWHRLRVPLLTLHTDLDGETLAVTVRDSSVTYDVKALLAGRIQHVHIPQATVTLETHGRDAGQPCPSSQATTRPDLLTWFTVGHLVRPLPLLPVQALTLDHVQVFRACATGPLRDVRISGTIQQVGMAVESSFVFQGEDSAVYRLQFALPQTGSLEASLRTETPAAAPIVLVQSRLHQEASGVHVTGTATVDFAQLAPFLAVLMPLGADLQQVAGSLQAQWTGTAPATAALDTAWQAHQAALSGALTLSLHLPQVAGLGRGVVVQLQGALKGNSRQLAWTLQRDSRLQADLAPHALPEALTWFLPTQPQRVVLECLETVQGKIVFGKAAPPWHATGQMRLQYGTAESPFQVEVVNRRISAQGSTLHLADATYHSIGTLPQVPPEILHANTVRWDVRGNVTLNKQQVSGTVEASSVLHITEMLTAALVVPTATLQFTERLPFRLHLKNLQWSAAPVQLTAQIPHATWQDTTVAMQPVQLAMHKLQGTLGRWQTAGVLRLHDVTVQHPGVTPPTTQWEVTFSADTTALQVQAQAATSQNTVMLKSTLHYPWTQQIATAEFHLSPISFAPPGVPWQAWLAPARYPFDVTDGQVAAVATVTWDKRAGERGESPWRGSTTLTIEHLSGFYQNIVLHDLSTTLRFEAVGMQALHMPEPALLTIATMQAGVDFTDITLRCQLGWQAPATVPWVECHDISLAFLGGKVTSPGIRFDSAMLPQTLPLTLAHIDLQKLLQLEHQQGITGTGLLDGVIPVIVTATGAQVQDGVLESRPPGGILQYRSAPGATLPLEVTPSQLQMVLQALENFHYTVLKMQVQYAEDGTLSLAAQLEGRNPAWQQGRPVHLNLTVRENIPALLQTLQIVQGIPQAIENRLQRR